MSLGIGKNMAIKGMVAGGETALIKADEHVTIENLRLSVESFVSIFDKLLRSDLFERVAHRLF